MRRRLSLRNLLLLITIFLIISNFVNNTLVGLAPYVRFYVAGSFDFEISHQNDSTSVRNVAYFADNRWQALGTESPDGEIYTITTDLCRNVYIGGNFSHVGSTYTGPIAKYSFRQRKWFQIGQNENPLAFTNGSYVKTISTVCQSFPNDAECQCNVYIGGKFEILGASQFNAGGHRAINVAKWNDEKGLWDPMGGIFTPVPKNETDPTTNNVVDDSFEVRTIFRRWRMDTFPNCGLVYIGGSFPGYFKIYQETLVDSFSDGIWSTPKDSVLINGPVNTVFAMRVDWPEDPTIVGMTGEFDIDTINNIGEEVYCKTVCSYNVDSDSLNSMGLTSDYNLNPFGSISTFFRSGQITATRIRQWNNDFYMSFVSPISHSNTSQNISTTTTPSSYCGVLALNKADGTWSVANCGTSMQNVTDFCYCGAYDPGCPTGSFFITDGKRVSIINAKDSSDNDLDFPGKVSQINGNFKINSIYFGIAMNSGTKSLNYQMISLVFIVVNIVFAVSFV